MTSDSTLLALIADWCINLSAGWFGASVIIPAISEKTRQFDEKLFLENILLALAFFLFALTILSI